nr:DUF87 domain-containing protein [uncultured Lysinibacillus sp.]
MDKNLQQLLDDLKELQELQSSERTIMFQPAAMPIDIRNMTFFRLQTIVYDDKFPQREAMEYVLSTLDNENFSFVYLLKGTPEEVAIYLGVTERKVHSKEMTASNYGRKLEAAFQGYFQGSKLEKLSAEQIVAQILHPLNHYRRASTITGVPTVHEKANDKGLDFQGLDKLVNGLGSGHWMMIVIAQRMAPRIMEMQQDMYYSIYNNLVLYGKKGVQKSDSETKNNGRSDTEGDTTSETKGKSNSSVNSTTKGDNKSTTFSDSKSVTVGKTESVEVINKQLQEIALYMEEVAFKRMRHVAAKGLFKTSIYILGQDLDMHERLKSNVISVYQGDEILLNPLRAHRLDNYNNGDFSQLVKSFMPVIAVGNYSRIATSLLNIPSNKGLYELATMLSTEELSYLTSLPHKELPGVSLKNGVDFGLNFDASSDKETITLGKLINRGQKNLFRTVTLTPKQINKHTFIAGVTGSGKTTTCQKILLSSNMPFLVIEPAKTEYRGMSQMPGMQDLIIYTLGNEQLSPFRLNPFELLPYESITSHIDMLKATFTAAFPMEGAMPQILEEAMYECYTQLGWDIKTNTNEFTDNPWEGKGIYFPTISMLVNSLNKVVNKQGFGAELKANYIGSLVSRLSNLTIGTKGLMLNTHLSIDFDKLLESKVIIEMEDVKSSEDKALLIGLILARVSEALKRKHKANKHYKHITLVEEAHRLLSKVDFTDAPSKKAAVETFSDLLAEVRKYGEGLIIVDQIPNKLASEVLKNTNTKIIHRIFAQDDKEVIGDTMMMDHLQKDFLSSLSVGEAIVFSEGMHKPIHVAIEAHSDTSDNQVDDKVLKEIGKNNMFSMRKVYYPLATMLKLPVEKERDIGRAFDKACQFFVQHKDDDIYEAYEQFKMYLEPIQKLANMTDRNLLEVLIFYQLLKSHQISFVKFSSTTIEEYAKEIERHLVEKTYQSTMLKNAAFHVFNLNKRKKE